jgi:uncharacterized FlaG/YvyC family protein
MNDTSIKPINGIQRSDGSALSKALTPVQTETTGQVRSSSASQEKLQIKTKAEESQINGLDNVSIHFRVDDKTNNVTVFLVDRKSKKVLRSIPASELQKLQIGDLLKLTV